MKIEKLYRLVFISAFLFISTNCSDDKVKSYDSHKELNGTYQAVRVTFPDPEGNAFSMDISTYEKAKAYMRFNYGHATQYLTVVDMEPEIPDGTYYCTDSDFSFDYDLGEGEMFEDDGQGEIIASDGSVSFYELRENYLIIRDSENSDLYIEFQRVDESVVQDPILDCEILKGILTT